MTIKRKTYARAGLVGNPSDGYRGKTIAFTVKNFCAEVTLTESDRIDFVAGPSDQNHYTDLHALRDNVSRHGYYGGIRLVKATVKRFIDYCASADIALDASRNFSLAYESNIPQQVGMAGSSAIIIATLRCLMAHYGVEIDQRIQPSLALAVESEELGIGGGLQDRVVQVYEGLVAMDFSQMDNLHGYDCGTYTPLELSCLPPVYVAWRPASSEPTEVFHNDLRARFDAGDLQVIDAMRRFVDLTDRALDSLRDHNHKELAKLLDANFDCRQSFCVLNPKHVEMIETARTVGVSAKYAGSGGAIVGTFGDVEQLEALQTAMRQIGCEVIQPQL